MCELGEGGWGDVVGWVWGEGGEGEGRRGVWSGGQSPRVEHGAAASARGSGC